MLPLLGGLITGGASLLGNYFSSQQSAANTQAQIGAQESMQAQSEAFNASQSGIARDFASSQAGIQRDYETQMSNTAYQRASADMQKAGLNPMMMFGSGGAASTPSVSAPSVGAASIGTPNVPMPSKTSPFAGLGDAVQKAFSTAVDMKSFEATTQKIANMKSEQNLVNAQVLSELNRPAQIQAQTGLTSAETTKTKQDVLLRKPAEAETEGVLKLGPDILGNVGKLKYGAGTLEDIAGPIVSTALRAKGLGLLKSIMGEKSPNSWRRGYDAGQSDSGRINITR